MCEEDYIKSIKGIVSSAEFDMHIRYLLHISKTVYNKYASELRNNDNRFKTVLEKYEVENFLNYVKRKRQNIKDFEQDISTLLYCDEENEKQDVKDVYDKIFRCTKMLLWHVIPYESPNITAIDHFYNKRAKLLNGNVKLEYALRRICMLYDNPDQILTELKHLLATYHSDKNKHEKARKVYEKVDLVYKAVNTILKEYERYYGDTIFCNFKMFLGKKLQDIDGDKVYEEMVSIYKTLRMNEYSENRDQISNIRDDMIEKCRQLITVEDIILAKKINYPKPEKCKGLKEKTMEKEYENQIEGIKKLSKQTKETIKNLHNLNEKLKLQVQMMLEECSVIKDRCSNEIEKHSDVLTNDAFSTYYQQKKIKSFKNMLAKLDEEQKEINVFLLKLTRQNFFDMVKNFDLTQIFSLSRDGIQSVLKDSYKTVKNIKFREILNILKHDSEAITNISSLGAEYNFIWYYSNLFAKYQRTRKKIDNYEVKFDGNGKSIFYKELEDSSSNEMNFDAILENLRSESNQLNKIFKTQLELEKESKNNLSVTKDLKKKSIKTRERIELLRSENEISEKRAEAAEAKIKEIGTKLEKEKRAKEEEIRAREKAEEKIEIEKAEKKALDLLYDEADDQDISRKKIKQNKDVQNFLECQYTFLVLNKDYTAKFKNLYKKLKEMKEFDFEMLPELANEFERLSRCFAEGKRRMEESRETMPECNDENIDRLKNSIMIRAREAKDVAEEEKSIVENEKQRAELLQMKIPNSAYSDES